MQVSSYIVSARKYRPRSFEDVVGQKTITDTLKKSIEENRLAQVLLFCGQRGVGKTTCARILAQKINTVSHQTGTSDFNFNVFELDAASNNSVDDIRNLIDQVRFAPQQGRYKVYIIDEVHMLSQAAFNAFLKTLEEPPRHAIFILATTEKHKILPTILSRCQVYEFRRISVKEIQLHLKDITQKEGIEASDEALFFIAQRADGALRDALSILDRLISFAGKVLTREVVVDQLGILDRDYYFKITDLFLRKDIPQTLLLLDEVLQTGFDAELFIIGLTSHFRDLLVSKDPRTLALLEFDEETKQNYITQAEETLPDFLINALELCKRTELNYKSSKNPRLSIEIALMQLASLTTNNHTIKKKFDILPSRETKAQSPLKGEDDSKSIEKQIQTTMVEPTHQQTASDQSLVHPVEPPITSPSRPTHFSILQALEEPRLDKDPDRPLKNLPNDSYTVEEFQRAWDDFLKNPLLRQNTPLWNILSTFKWELIDNKVCLYFSSHAAAGEFSSIQQEFLEHLRQELHNFRIQFEPVVKAGQLLKTIYTPEEKYRFLVERNPYVAQLRERLGLDLYD